MLYKDLRPQILNALADLEGTDPNKYERFITGYAPMFFDSHDVGYWDGTFEEILNNTPIAYHAELLQLIKDLF